MGFVTTELVVRLEVPLKVSSVVCPAGVLVVGMVVGLGLMGPRAHAEKVAGPDKAKSAKAKSLPMLTVRELAAILWSSRVDCSKLTNDLQRRQCVGLVSARRSALANRSFVVRGDARAIAVSASGPISVSLFGCVACEQPMSIDGEALFATIGPGKVLQTDGAIRGPEISRTTIKPKSAAVWRKQVSPRLRAEFVVRLGGGEAWKQGSARGLRLQRVGHRLYDPCTGTPIHVSHPGVRLPIDASTCPATVAKPEPKPEPKPIDTSKKVPLRLTTNQLVTALRPAADAARECHEEYGVTGVARLRITVDGSGTVAHLTQRGDFVDTPTGACIDKAIRSARFPKFRAANQSFSYPLRLF